MNIIEKKVKDLKPYEKNPRLNDDAVKYVAESIRNFGFKVPIVIDKDNNIVCGHTRWKACKKLKIDTVPDPLQNVYNNLHPGIDTDVIRFFFVGLLRKF